MAWFSNWDDPIGADDVDIAAPGVNVKSYYKNDQLAYLNGTSMAAPGVAGLLITGGLEAGNNVIAGADQYADPFALTKNTPSDDGNQEDGNGDDNTEDGNQDNGNGDDNTEDGNQIMAMGTIILRMGIKMGGER